MISQKGILASQFDYDALLFLSAVGITDPTQRLAVNYLTFSLKVNGLWDKLNAIYPFVGGTATTHKFNLKNPADTNAAFRLLFVGGVTHSSNGVTFDGANGYADTFMAASTTLTANNNSLSYYSRTLAAGASLAVDMGAFPNQTTNSSGYSLIIRRSDNTSAFSANTTSTTSFAAVTSTTNGTGFFNGSIINSSSRKFYRNGSVIATNTTTGIQSLPPQKIFLGALSNNNVASLFSSRQCTFASIGSGLSDSEATVFYNIVQTFQIILGRSIGTQTVSDPDAQAFINAAIIEDQVQSKAINTLVIDLKANGLWTKLKAIYPFVGGTATTNKFNLKDPRDLDAAFRLSFVGGWVHSDNGSTPNGTNAYANTFYNCSAQSTVSNACFGVYSRTNSITGTQVYGAFTSTNVVRMFHNFSAPNIQIVANPGGIGYTPNVSTGFFLSRRESTTLNQSYRNGVSGGTSTVSTTNLPNHNFYFGAANSDGNTQFYTTHQLAFGVLGGNATITDADSLTLYNIVQTFQTNLSRQI